MAAALLLLLCARETVLGAPGCHPVVVPDTAVAVVSNQVEMHEFTMNSRQGTSTSALQHCCEMEAPLYKFNRLHWMCAGWPHSYA